MFAPVIVQLPVVCLTYSNRGGPSIFIVTLDGILMLRVWALYDRSKPCKCSPLLSLCFNHRPLMPCVLLTTQYWLC